MNRRGFTLIELITTFALATTIIIILINIVLLIKNIYNQNYIKSTLIIEQSNLSNLINEKLEPGALKSYTPCGDSNYCYNLDFVDGTTIKLVVDEEIIKVNTYVYKLPKGTKVENPTLELIDVEVTSVGVNNSFLVIKIPIKNKLYPKQDFGLNIVYPYNSNEVTL